MPPLFSPVPPPPMTVCHFVTICPFYRLHPSFLFSGLKFPDGEQQFINAVRLYRDRIDDPKLKVEIRGFIGQEALHSREHKDYNEALKARGYDIDGLDRRFRKHMEMVGQALEPSHLDGRAQLSVGKARHFAPVPA